MSTPCFLIRPNVCIIGDSTVINHYYLLPQYHLANTKNLAVSGNTITQQKTAWLALSSGVRALFDYIFVQVGLNELGASSISQYQDLINTINLSRNSTCRVYGVCMTPTRAAISEIEYGSWLALNAAIRGEGATPITGMYGSVSSHLAIMGDENNNLIAAYDSGDHRHPNLSGNSVNCEEISKVMATS